MAPFLTRNDAPFQLEGGSRGCQYRRRTSCGGEPLAVRPPNNDPNGTPPQGLRSIHPRIRATPSG